MTLTKPRPQFHVRKRTVRTPETVCTPLHRLPERTFALRPVIDLCVGLDEAPGAWKWSGTDVETDVVLSVFDARERENTMDLHIPTGAEVACSYLLRFTSLHDRGRAIAVPCDRGGNVDIDSLSLQLRTAYLGARAMVGREYSRPTVQQLA